LFRFGSALCYCPTFLTGWSAVIALPTPADGKPALGVWVMPDMGGGAIMFIIGVIGVTEFIAAGFIVLFIDAPPVFICAIIIIIYCCCIMNWTCSGVMLPFIELIMFIYICCIWAIIAICAALASVPGAT